MDEDDFVSIPGVRLVKRRAQQAAQPFSHWGATTAELRQVTDPSIPRPQRPSVAHQERQAAIKAQNDFFDIPGVKAVSAPPVTATQRAGAFAHGAGSGFLDSGAPITGLAAGALAGAPLGPGGIAIGGALGMTAGWLAGRTYRAAANVPRPEELPQELRPYAYSGEVLGSGGPITQAVMAGRAGTTGIKFIDRIVESMREAPKRFAAVETASLGASATAEGVAEQLRPGETTFRVGSGLVAGTLFPNAISMLVADFGMGSYNRVMASMSREGQMGALAEQLQTLVRVYGEDPATLARALREADLPGMHRTAAQLTGSEALQDIERLLMRKSAQFSRQAAATADDSLVIMRGRISALESTGDPRALREASRMRTQYYEGLINSFVRNAEEEVVAATAPLRAVGQEQVTEMSIRARDILDNALTKARQAEREIWSSTDQTIRVSARNVVNEASTIRMKDILPDESLPSLVSSFTSRMRYREGRGLSTAASELILFRSRMLDEARRLDAAGDSAGARIHGKLAEAVLEDLSGVPGYDEARAFSRTLNDVFTRSFVGDAEATSRTGRDRLPPELLLRRATSGGSELTALRMAELERAVQLGSPEATSELVAIMETSLRYAARKLLNEETGLVTPRRLADFKRDNETLLNRFPELREQLDTVESANTFFARETARGREARDAIANRTAFARVAGAENPTAEVARMLHGRTPVRDIGQLSRLARADGDAAVRGLRAAILDDAFQRAGGDSGNVDFFTRYKRALTEPVRAGQPSSLDLMRRNDLMDASTERGLRQILTEAAKVEDAMRASGNLDAVMPDMTMLADLVVRVSSLKAASAAGVTTGAGGGGIAIASGVSRFSRHVMNKVPLSRIQDLAIEAAENPRMMADLLTRPVSQAHRMKLSRRINAYLWSAMLNDPEEFMPEISIEEQP